VQYRCDVDHYLERTGEGGSGCYGCGHGKAAVRVGASEEPWHVKVRESSWVGRHVNH
jgi:hypothetical protein